MSIVSLQLPWESVVTVRSNDPRPPGRVHVTVMVAFATDGSTRAELYLWHYFGDPSMQMWGGDPPIRIDVSQIVAVYKQLNEPGGDPGPYEVNVTVPATLNGQTLSLLRNGDTVGKGIVQNGKVTIVASFGDGSVKPGDLQVASDSDGVEPFTAPVTVPKQTTTLTQNCPNDTGFNGDATVSGSLGPSVAGATITVTWTRPGGRGSFDRTVTTDSQGNWSDTIDTGPDFDPGGGGSGGTWSVHASYAGDDKHEASSTQDCSFQEESG